MSDRLLTDLIGGINIKTSGARIVAHIKILYLQSSLVYPRISMPVTPINSYSEFQSLVRGTIHL